jgi:serpin B
MMTQTQSYGYVRGPNYTALELPYQGGTTSMVLVVPDSGAYQGFEANLTGGDWYEILGELEPSRVQLSLPRFEFESGFALRPALESLGMADAFSIETADFSGMDGSLELYIHDVVHKAYVAVDEEGTEAAAATAVIMASKAMLDPPIEIRIDRPFLFFIRDLETNTILFMGRVLDPAQ